MEAIVTDPLERAEREAEAAFAAVRDDPAGRYQLAERFFDDPKAAGARPYGRAELSFLDWEIRRGVLDPLTDESQRGSAWWRAVNESILRDAAEAQALYDAGCDLAPRRASVGLWRNFLCEPGPVTFYNAHNSSVVDGFFTAAPLAIKETPVERTLMNLTLARVLFVQTMAESPGVALGRFRCVGRVLSTPSSGMVTLVVRHPDLYPDHYELTLEDQRRVHGKVHTPEGMVTAFINDVVLAPRLREVYSGAATAIGEPRLLDLLDKGRPSYPWGLPGIGPAPERHDPWPHPRRLSRLFQIMLTPILGRPSAPVVCP